MPSAGPTNASQSVATPRPDGPTAADRRPDVLVVGAGVMGAWTAFWARVGGAGPGQNHGGDRSVTLLDAWGAGHARATSGEGTRVLRSAHGDDAFYARWARLARDSWIRFEQEWGTRLFLQTGVVWFGQEAGGFEERSSRVLESEGIPQQLLTPAEVRRRWPQIGTDGLHTALWEPEAGALLARHSVQATVAAFQRAGGRYSIAAVRPGRSKGGRLLAVIDAAGAEWLATTFVFACGPWLPKVFPEELGGLVRVTKQDVLYVGPPPNDDRFGGDGCPSWADHGGAYYGIPAIGDDGFKIAPDRYGPVFDPSRGDRLVDPDSVRLARAYLERRFPGLAGAPITASRVCQYETTPDGHFLIGRLPGYDNVWVVGGGSGHGFKHGPQIGSYAVARIDGAAEGSQFGADEERFRVGPRRSQDAAGTGRDIMARAWELF
jgi:sarcosine oxidase